MARQRDAARSKPQARRVGEWRVLAVAASVLLVLLSVSLAVSAVPGRPPRVAAPHATPTIDPRLILRAQSLPISGVLSHAVHLRGTLFPAIPGRNTLRLVVQSPLPVRVVSQRLLVVATMPGMAMPPIRATLVAHGAHYSAALTLPMFGTYRAQITVETTAGRATGMLILRLLLP